MLENDGFIIISPEELWNDEQEIIDQDAEDKKMERQAIADKILRVFNDKFINHVDRAAFNISFWAHTPEDIPQKIDMSTRIEALRSAMGMSDMTGRLNIRGLEPEDEEYVLKELNRVYCLQKLLIMGVLDKDDPHICDSDDIVNRWSAYDYAGSRDIRDYIVGDKEFDSVPQ